MVQELEVVYNFLYLAPLLNYDGLKSNMPTTDFNLRYILVIEQDIKKLYTSSNSTPFGTLWTKFETHNPIVVGEDRFWVKTCVSRQLWDMSV